MIKSINTNQSGSSLIDKVQRVLRLQYARLKFSSSPDFLILGAQKAGTSSLFSLLKSHPRIEGAVDKEIHFFDRDEFWNKGLGWYENRFSSWKPRVLHHFEATPDYMYRKGSIERIHSVYPDMKLVIILREPVSRAYSAWNMFRDFQLSRRALPSMLRTGYLQDTENSLTKYLYDVEEFPSFEEIVSMEMEWIETGVKTQEPSFIRRGFYMNQINEILKYFNNDQLLVLSLNELREDERGTLNSILRFINLPTYNWEVDSVKHVKNARAYLRSIDEGTREALQKLYEPHNKELFNFLGRELW